MNEMSVMCKCGHQEKDHTDKGGCYASTWGGECGCRKFKLDENHIETKYTKLLAEIKRLKAEREWQPIETPPETTDHVIVCNKNSEWGGLHFMTIGWYNIELGHWVCNTIPTHWMPLPQPPEEK